MKRKQDHESHIDETWLIPYADLLTLLLALFIVLFAASNADEAKMSAMQQSFYEEYNGVLPDPETGDPGIGGSSTGSDFIPGVSAGGDDPETDANFFATDPPAVTQSDGAGDESFKMYNHDMHEELVSNLKEEFTEYVKQNGLEQEMMLETTPDGLLVTLTSDVWFDSGSADINESQKEIAAEISKMIADMQAESNVKLSIIVSGHTDNVPMSNLSEFANNWQLSVGRAVNFMEELMNTSDLQPSNFSARGFGEFEPIDTNDTPEGRQRNRRVEVLIAPEIPIGS